MESNRAHAHITLTPQLTLFHLDVVWTDQNRLAAETWKAVDEGFYDRTFNGNAFVYIYIFHVSSRIISHSRTRITCTITNFHDGFLNIR